jgi:hypothetical protein
MIGALTLRGRGTPNFCSPQGYLDRCEARAHARDCGGLWVRGEVV